MLLWLSFLVLFIPKQVFGSQECKTSDKKGVAGKLSTSNYIKVGAKWWYNWQHWRVSDWSDQVEMVPMIRFCKDSRYCIFYDRVNNRVNENSAVVIEALVAKRGQGGYWLIGNEPEMPNQDEVYDPVMTAKMYRELVDFIKIYDPEAKFIVGGWTGPEENKKNWPLLLKRKWSEYGLKGSSLCSDIAGWHFHDYAWPGEYSSRQALSAWVSKTDDFADYLLDLCPAKEIWITEFGSLSANGSDAEAVASLARGMGWMVDALEANEKISRYAWFYAIDGPVYEPNLPGLFTAVNGQMSVLGQTFAGLGEQSCETTATATLTSGNCLKKDEGDADCDGQITLVDASIWRQQYIDGEMGELVRNNWEADFDGNGKVNLVDRSTWRENYVLQLEID